MKSCVDCIHNLVCAIYGPSHNDILANNEECRNFKPTIRSEWDLRIDDFEDGLGARRVPYCKHCGHSVYRHDAGNYCPFCGSTMTNPMR